LNYGGLGDGGQVFQLSYIGIKKKIT